MVYNTQNYRIFGLCPSSGILTTRKHNVSKLDLFPSSGECETRTLLGPLGRSLLFASCCVLLYNRQHNKFITNKPILLH
jgi:hypothetical protein